MLNERNEKIDELGRRLTRQNNLSDNDLEQIVAAPQMWQNLRRQIQIEKAMRRKRFDVISSWQKVFGVRQIALKATFAVICVVGSMFGLWFLVSGFAPSGQSDVADFNKTDVSQNLAINEIVSTPQTVEAIDDAVPQSRKAVSGLTQIKFAPKQPSRLNKAQDAVNKQVVRDFKTNKKFDAVKTKLPKTPKQNPNENIEEQSEFYALSFAGNSNANEMKQIVRVNLSPAALIKLGVSNSLATIDSSVTADLLLGEDGSPQAIRFIR